MSEQGIIEGNKLIAEFMELGWETIKEVCISNLKKYGHRNPDYLNNPMYWNCYHSSWDWLMPVVEKIEYLYATDYILPRFEINSHTCSFSVGYPKFKKYKQWICGCYNSSPEKEKRNTKIEAAYYICVEFIKWYNLRQKKKQ